MEFYAEYDEETGYYCVFDTDKGKAWSSYCTMQEAENEAEERNRSIKQG